MHACVFLLFFEIYRHFATAISSEKLAAMPACYTKLSFEYGHLHSIAERVLQRKEEKETNQKSAYDLLITNQYSSFKNISYQWVDF